MLPNSNGRETRSSTRGRDPRNEESKEVVDQTEESKEIIQDQQAQAAAEAQAQAAAEAQAQADAQADAQAAVQAQAQAAVQAVQAQAVAPPSAPMPPPAARPPSNQVVLSPAAVQQLFSPQGEKISSLVKRIVTLTHGNFAAWLKALNGIAYYRRWDKSRLMNTNFTWDQVEEDDPISNQQRRDAFWVLTSSIPPTNRSRRR